jgi:hypothetical protein
LAHVWEEDDDRGDGPIWTISEDVRCLRGGPQGPDVGGSNEWPKEERGRGEEIRKREIRLGGPDWVDFQIGWWRASNSEGGTPARESQDELGAGVQECESSGRENTRGCCSAGDTMPRSGWLLPGTAVSQTAIAAGSRDRAEAPWTPPLDLGFGKQRTQPVQGGLL